MIWLLIIFSVGFIVSTAFVLLTGVSKVVVAYLYGWEVVLINSEPKLRKYAFNTLTKKQAVKEYVSDWAQVLNGDLNWKEHVSKLHKKRVRMFKQAIQFQEDFLRKEKQRADSCMWAAMTK